MSQPDRSAALPPRRFVPLLLVVRAGGRTRFPFHLRIPAWAAGAELRQPDGGARATRA